MAQMASNWIIIASAWFAASAFTIQNQPTPTGKNGWQGLTIVFVIIFILAILLIFQSRKTPENLARYHLDHAAHDAEHDHTENGSIADEVIAAEDHDTKTSQPEETMNGDSTSPEAEHVAPDEESQVESTDSTVTTPTSTAADDLTRLEGVGPKIAELLNEAGITTYVSLAQAEPGRLAEILKGAGPRFALADPSSWPEQAGYLAAGDLDQFNALSTRLKSGRRVD